MHKIVILTNDSVSMSIYMQFASMFLSRPSIVSDVIGWATHWYRVKNNDIYQDKMKKFKF